MYAYNGHNKSFLIPTFIRNTFMGWPYSVNFIILWGSNKLVSVSYSVAKVGGNMGRSKGVD